MTHDELLLDVSEVLNWYEDQERFAEVVPYLLALQKVVELHKPLSDKMQFCMECKSQYNGELDVVAYPCHTIQAIEKELQ